MITSETGLLDTNVLVYAADEKSPFHQAASILRERGLKGEISLCVTPQVLTEFFAIVTDRRRVAQARVQDDAVQEVEKYVRAKNVSKIYSHPQTFDKSLELLKHYAVKGQAVFDLQLVATMLSNGVRRIYTYNAADFSQFREIEVISPETVLK